MIDRYIFVDEAGNYGFKFDKENVSKYFVVTAIIVEKKNIEQLEKEMEKTRRYYFQTGEMKSSKLKIARRKSIINSISQSDFQIYSLVINKKKLYTDGGLSYKKSFFKFIHSILYKFLFETHDTIQVMADNIGSKEYMEEFESYVSKRHIRNLFDNSEFLFGESKSNVLIQLADIIGGTIFQKFEKDNSNYDTILKTLGEKILRIEEWPITYYKKSMDMTSKYDNIIAQQAVNLLNKFIEKNTHSEDQRVINQINFLKFLRTNYLAGRHKYIKGDEIRDNLNSISNEHVSSDGLRTNIVAPLRDEGLLIASTVNGYKLSTTKADLMDYVEFSSATILPMLNRLDKCRNRILTATSNELDILDEEGLRELKEFLDGKFHRV